MCILKAAIPVLCRLEMPSLIPEVLQTSSHQLSIYLTHTHIMSSIKCISGSLNSVCAFQGIVIFKFMKCVLIQKDFSTFQKLFCLMFSNSFNQTNMVTSLVHGQQYGDRTVGHVIPKPGALICIKRFGIILKKDWYHQEVTAQLGNQVTINCTKKDSHSCLVPNL